MRHISQNPKHHQFEYQTLTDRQCAEIQKLTREIREKIRTTAQTIWDIGHKLVEARSQLDPCQFSSWLQMEFDWSRRTAYNFINVFEAFPELGRAKFARVDISISALYLLAAPSTQQEIRHDFLNRALAGEYVTHKVIQTAIQEVKEAERDDNDNLVGSAIPDVDRVCRNTLQIEPQISQRIDRDTIPSNLTAFQLGSTVAEFEVIASDLRPAWNRILQESRSTNGQDFSLFWGDTTSPRFIDRLPTDAFVLAIPSCQWHHEWLLSKRISAITLFQPMLRDEFVESLLSTFSQEDKALIFPWLPHWKTIETALNLNIKVYAGDPDLQQCERTIAKLGLKNARIERQRW
jgi:hypothetical protein